MGALACGLDDVLQEEASILGDHDFLLVEAGLDDFATLEANLFVFDDRCVTVTHLCGHTPGDAFLERGKRLGVMGPDVVAPATFELRIFGVLGGVHAGFTDENVSDKVVKIIQSYTGVVNKMVWRKDA